MLVSDPDRSFPHLEHVLSINRLECQSANSKSAGVFQAGTFLHELHKASGGKPGTDRRRHEDQRPLPRKILDIAAARQ